MDPTSSTSTPDDELVSVAASARFVLSPRLAALLLGLLVSVAGGPGIARSVLEAVAGGA